MPEGIVVDTGPLVAFASIDRLDLIHRIYSRVYVPAAVRDEVLAAGGTKPGAAAIRTASWLETVTVEPVESMLSAELGRGEAEVIAFATSRPDIAVLIDERRGRRIAETVYGLTVRGTVGTLVVAKRRHLIAELRPLLDVLKRSGYHLSESLIATACRTVGEE